MIQLKEDGLEHQRNLFSYNVVFPVAPISKTIEFRNSITKYINNSELESIPTQYIISYVDDEKEVEKAYQVLEAVKAIKKHELRQKLAEEVSTSVIWKDIEDMEQYAELLKSELKNIDRIKINSYILVSKKFVSFKKPMNPSKFQTHPAVLELFALCAIPAVSLKGRKNTSANNA